MPPLTVRQRADHVWAVHFATYSKSPSIRQRRNLHESIASPPAFVLQNLVSFKHWMLAWKKNAFDELLEFNVDNLQNEDQDLYRDITSYTFAELNTLTRDMLQLKHQFVGNDFVHEDGVDVPKTRSTLAMQKLANGMCRKESEIFSREAFIAFFAPREEDKKRPWYKGGLFQKLRRNWGERVAALRAPSPKPPSSIEPAVGVAVSAPPRAGVSPPMPSAAELAHVATSAATAAADAQPLHTVRVTVEMTPASATEAVVVVPPPPVEVPDVQMAEAEVIAAEPAPPSPVSAAVAAVVTPSDDDATWWSRLNSDLLLDEFETTAKWMRRAETDVERLGTTRVEKSGFRMFAKERGTASAKTRGARDAYCQIKKDSRAERLCIRAGVSLKKQNSLLLRSKNDVRKFWQKIVDAGIDVGSVV